MNLNNINTTFDNPFMGLDYGNKKHEELVCNILLIDDDEDDFVLTREMVKEIPGKGFKLNWISSYEQALEAMLSCKYDVFLIDYRLGKHTGIELMTEAINKGCSQPIIMLTGKGDKRIDEEAMKSGAADYLVKDKIDSFLLERAIRYSVERSKSLEKIRESELRYKNIFDRSRDLIYIADAQGWFVDINNSACVLLGLSREELLRRTIFDFFHSPADADKLKAIMAEKGEVADWEVDIVGKDSKRISCLFTSNLHIVDNGQVLFQGIIHDISKRKKAEEDVLSSEKLAVTGRLARMIAHEVRNPLTNVNLSIEQIKSEVAGGLQDISSLEIYIDIIKRNSERINQLITELLDSTKAAQLKMSSTTCTELIEGTLALALDRIQLKKIKVEKDFSDKPCKILVDQDKMKIALLNIMINAVEAMEEDKGVLTLSTKNKDDGCTITITDNGLGIPADSLKNLFEPFFSKKSKGMGLGLTSSQNIIINHKGTINVSSEVNKGTSFEISFKSEQSFIQEKQF